MLQDVRLPSRNPEKTKVTKYTGMKIHLEMTYNSRYRIKTIEYEERLLRLMRSFSRKPMCKRGEIGRVSPIVVHNPSLVILYTLELET